MLHHANSMLHVGMGRYHDDPRRGMVFPDMPEQGETIHVRHHEVGYDEVIRVDLQQVHGLQCTSAARYLKAVTGKQPLKKVVQEILVIDEQQMGLVGHWVTGEKGRSASTRIYPITEPMRMHARQACHRSSAMARQPASELRTVIWIRRQQLNIPSVRPKNASSNRQAKSQIGGLGCVKGLE
jgi:hypothetical protein